MRGYHRDATTSPLSRKQTGSYEVIPESVQYLYRLYSKEVVHLTKELCLKEEKLTSIPLVMRNFKHLHKLDLSYNLLTSLPVKILDEYFPHLTSLDVSYNRLGSIEDIQQLGKLPLLQELNVLGNPLLAVNQRPLLLSLLIFNQSRPTREQLEGMLGYSDAAGRGTTKQDSSGSILASESISKMLVAGLQPGNVLPRVAVARLSRAGLRATSRFAVYCDLSAAPVPRNSPFPFLVVLNELEITKEDLDAAARMAPRRSPLQAKKAKAKRLMGKRRMEELERFTDAVQNAYRERKIEHTLKKLLEEGVIDDGSSFEEEGKEEEEGEGGEEEEEEEEDLIENGNMGDEEDVLSEVAQRTYKLRSVSSMLENRLNRMEDNSSDGVSDNSFQLSMSRPKTGTRQRQTTCPASWWDQEWMLNDGGLQEIDLPTRLSVVDQGAEELERTKRAVEKLTEIGHAETSPSRSSTENVAIESKYQSLREEVDDLRKKETASNLKMLSSSTPSSSSAARAKQLNKFKSRFEFSDMLRWELSIQKDRDSTFLTRDLPGSVKRLNVDEWMQQGVDEAVQAEEIDRLFTATNIQNKVDTHQVNKMNRETVFFQRKMAFQSQQQNFVEKWHNHRNRLSLIRAGKYPTDTPARRSTSSRSWRDAGGNQKGDDREERRREERGEEERGVVQESSKANVSGKANFHVVLSRALDKLERTLMSPTEETADVSQGSKAAGSGSDVQPASKGTRTQKHRKAEDYTKMFDLGINRILQTKDTRQQDDRAAAMLIPRANLREVRRELKEYHDNFVSQRLRFFEERTDMEAMVDKIIVANRFGQFGARRMQVAGVEFEEDS